MSDRDELKQNFWQNLAKSPFVFLHRDDEPHSAVPMTAQLDQDAHGAIWFFINRSHPLAALGPATATFASKDNQFFARLSGTLFEETSRARLDKQWNSIIEAWFDGKDDPKLLMLRYELGEAELWNSDLGMVDNIKMLLGFDMTGEAREEHLETTL